MSRVFGSTPNSAIDPTLSGGANRDGSQTARSSGKRVLPWIYLSTALIALFAGYFWRSNQYSVSPIYFLKPPEVAADVVFVESLLGKDIGLDGIDGFHGVLRNAVVITEQGRQGGGQTNCYICPQSANRWGELELKWEWDRSLQPALGILDLNMHVFPQFDPTAVAEMYLASEETKGRWVQMVTLSENTHDRNLFEPIDATPWVKNSSYLKVLYRLKANRLIYHPTPNTPIGFAGAQCLRHAEHAPEATKLSLWKELPAGYAAKMSNRKD
jgi:hypothetical protein